jgi:hypothetical protein
MGMVVSSRVWDIEHVEIIDKSINHDVNLPFLPIANVGLRRDGLRVNRISEMIAWEQRLRCKEIFVSKRGERWRFIQRVLFDNRNSLHPERWRLADIRNIQINVNLFARDDVSISLRINTEFEPRLLIYSKLVLP